MMYDSLTHTAFNIDQPCGGDQQSGKLFGSESITGGKLIRKCLW